MPNLLHDLEVLLARMKDCTLISNTQFKEATKVLAESSGELRQLNGLTDETRVAATVATACAASAVILTMAKKEAGKSPKNQKKLNKCMEGLAL